MTVSRAEKRRDERNYFSKLIPVKQEKSEKNKKEIADLKKKLETPKVKISKKIFTHFDVDKAMQSAESVEIQRKRWLDQRNANKEIIAKMGAFRDYGKMSNMDNDVHDFINKIDKRAVKMIETGWPESTVLTWHESILNDLFKRIEKKDAEEKE